METKKISTSLLDILACPACRGTFRIVEHSQELVCKTCGEITPLLQGVPVFSEPPLEMIPSEKILRGPSLGTPWRQANWRFLEQELDRLPAGALILDVGAGRGDFSAAIQNHPNRLSSIALEVYPYPEIDVVCDLTQVNPFRPASFEAILLLNVLEHVYDSHALLGSLAEIVKPGGVLIIAIPFMVKLHQVPVDFVRYTHFALQRLGMDHGLHVDRLEGYYDPVFFLGEGIGNLRHAVLPQMKGMKRRWAHLLLQGISGFAGQLDRLLGPGRIIDPVKTQSMAPTGYLVVYRKQIK